MTTAPQTMLTAVWYCCSSCPAVPASAPISTKTTVNPATKPSAPASVLRVLRSPPPAK